MTHDDDLIRRGDVLAQVDYTSNSDDMCYGPFLRDRIAALPAAVPAVGVKPEDVDCIADAVWSEVCDSKENRWTLRREHIHNAVARTVAALAAMGVK